MQPPAWVHDAEPLVGVRWAWQSPAPKLNPFVFFVCPKEAADLPHSWKQSITLLVIVYHLLPHKLVTKYTVAIPISLQRQAALHFRFDHLIVIILYIVMILLYISNRLWKNHRVTLRFWSAGWGLGWGSVLLMPSQGQLCRLTMCMLQVSANVNVVAFHS